MTVNIQKTRLRHLLLQAKIQQRDMFFAPTTKRRDTKGILFSKLRINNHTGIMSIRTPQSLCLTLWLIDFSRLTETEFSRYVLGQLILSWTKNRTFDYNWKFFKAYSLAKLWRFQTSSSTSCRLPASHFQNQKIETFNSLSLSHWHWTDALSVQ